MNYYPDTSFLCALYRAQVNSKQADAMFRSLAGPLSVSTLLLFEFRQSVRFQIFIHRSDVSKGYGESEGLLMLADLDGDLSDGVLEIAPVDWAKVLSAAELLSARHTGKEGYRSFDVLHIATALELGAVEFLTFDARQKALAKAAGLKVKP